MKTMKDLDQKPFLISFWHTTKNALNGIALAAESERSFRIHVLAMVVVTVLGWYFELAMLEWGSFVSDLCANDGLGAAEFRH